MNILQVKKYYLLIKEVEQAKFAYSPLGKAFEKQTKAIEDKGEKPKSKIIKNSQIINNKVIMNYCYQRKEKYLRIFTTKDLIK